MYGERSGSTAEAEPSFRRGVVTGATGFIGRALIGRLNASGVATLALSRTADASAGDRAAHLDLAGPSPIDARMFEAGDVLFHLAAKTHDLTDAAGAEADYWRLNVDGTRRLLDAACRGGVTRVVFASSVKVSGEGGEQIVDESRTPVPLTAYGRSKLAAEEILRETARQGALTAVCLRFPIVYGVGQRGNLQRMIRAVDRGTFPPVPDTRNRRSMLHVQNAVQALWLAATHASPGPVYYVTDAYSYSTREIDDAIRRALGRPPRRWSVPAPVWRALAAGGDLARRLAGRRVGFDSEAFQKLFGSAEYSSSLIARELGYEPEHGLLAALPDLVRDVKGGR
jgi:nucleoside-diphosphate-sugar epimerase